MGGNILLLLIFVGAIGLFLFGIKLLGESIQRMTGNSLRKLLRKLTASVARGVGTGTFITAIIQSSSTMTVMIVSFAHAGLLSLRQSIPLIMGANIGTTGTAWLVALFGFNFDISVIALPLVGIGFPFLLARRYGLRTLGGFIVGFGLLLLAISILKTHLDNFTHDSSVVQAIANLSEQGGWAPLCFVGIGALITFVAQSSSAIMALTLVLSGSGLIPFECALALVLGENLGTTGTANIAALFTNRTAKQTALFHLLFNAIGVLWALPLLGVCSEGISGIMTSLGSPSPLSNNGAQPLALALFHTLFNAINTLLLVNFIPFLAHLIERILPVEKREKKGLRYIGSPLFSICELSIYQSQNQLHDMVHLSGQLFEQVMLYFRETNSVQADTIHKKTMDTTRQLRQSQVDLSEFLSQENYESVSRDGLRSIDHTQSLLSRLNRITTCLESLTRSVYEKRRQNIWFSPEMRKQIEDQVAIVRQVFGLLERSVQSSALPDVQIANIDTLNNDLSKVTVALTHVLAQARASDDCADRQIVIFREMSFMITTLTIRLIFALEEHTEPLHS